MANYRELQFAPLRGGISQSVFLNRPNLAPDVFEQEIEPMSDERVQMRLDLNDIMRNAFMGQGGPTLQNLSPQMMNLMSTMFGAANSAGRMVNSAYGGAPSSNGGRSDYDIVTQNFRGAPAYQQRGDIQSKIPAELRTELDKWKEYKEAAMNNTVGQYMTKHGALPDMGKVQAYIAAVPQNLQESMQGWALDTLDATRDARLRFNPNDTVGNAMLSNKHFSQLAYAQPGAKFATPEGNQKGNLFRMFGNAAIAPDDLLDWGDVSDAIYDEINPTGVSMVNFGYNSSGMGNGAYGSPDYAYQGEFRLRPEWGRQNSGLPSTMQPNQFTPRNNNDPNNFRTPGSSPGRSPNNVPNPSWAKYPQQASRYGPDETNTTGWGAFRGGADTRNRVIDAARGQRFQGGTANDLMRQQQQRLGGYSPYGAQSTWGPNPNALPSRPAFGPPNPMQALGQLIINSSPAFRNMGWVGN